MVPGYPKVSIHRHSTCHMLVGYLVYTLGIPGYLPECNQNKLRFGPRVPTRVYKTNHRSRRGVKLSHMTVYQVIISGDEKMPMRLFCFVFVLVFCIPTGDLVDLVVHSLRAIGEKTKTFS